MSYMRAHVCMENFVELRSIRFSISRAAFDMSTMNFKMCLAFSAYHPHPPNSSFTVFVADNNKFVTYFFSLSLSPFVSVRDFIKSSGLL